MSSTKNQRRSKAKVKRATAKRLRRDVALDHAGCECTSREMKSCPHLSDCMRDAAIELQHEGFIGTPYSRAVAIIPDVHASDKVTELLVAAFKKGAGVVIVLGGDFIDEPVRAERISPKEMQESTSRRSMML